MARYFTDHDVMLSSTRFSSPWSTRRFTYNTAVAATASPSPEGTKTRTWYVIVKGPGQIESGATTEEAADIEDEVKKRFPSAILKMFPSEEEARAYIFSVTGTNPPPLAPPPPPAPTSIPWGVIAAGGALIVGLFLLKRR